MPWAIASSGKLTRARLGIAAADSSRARRIQCQNRAYNRPKPQLKYPACASTFDDDAIDNTISSVVTRHRRANRPASPIDSGRAEVLIPIKAAAITARREVSSDYLAMQHAERLWSHSRLSCDSCSQQPRP